MGGAGAQWRPFTSQRRPGFDWDARIAVLPGVPVCVHDAYVAGEGELQARLFGLVPLADCAGRAPSARAS
jgi:hypothetical protein